MNPPGPDLSIANLDNKLARHCLLRGRRGPELTPGRL